MTCKERLKQNWQVLLKRIFRRPARSMSNSKLKQRVIRVFVSSTFRDMYAEREELVKRVFPQLRKLCEERGVTWGEVDLRWGISDEQKAEGKVLPICLAEIKNCRPYFIGLLGERYGWVPDEISQELIDQEPWLKEHFNHSVTELEILHGVLNNPKMADHAYFYFRDLGYLDSLPSDKQGEFREVPTRGEIKQYGPEEARRRSEEKKRKLKDLKQRIRESGFPVRENYHDPKELGKLVLQDMTEVINRRYPITSIPSPLEREANEHEAFAESRRRVYIGREEYFERLNHHVQGDNPPLVVIGESGCGKSALLANWAFNYRTQHPGDLVIMHFIGASPYSSDWMAMLRRIMGEFKNRFDIQLDIPDGPDALRAAFANWLHMVAARGRVVLIIDALNQLEDREGALDLVWLPPEIPADIRLILSTLPGRPQEDIERRKWPTLRVGRLTPDERQKLIDKYLKQYSKRLSLDRSVHIAEAEQTVNPLYLRVLLDELRVFGIHEKLDQRIDHYLSAPTVERLYEKVLERYEEDYEQDRSGLVGEAMSLLWAARRGLSEAELLDMLGSNQEPLPRSYWSPLYLAAEQSLVNRSGMIDFFHEYFRKAICNRYLSTKEKQQTAHLRLADYFQTRDQSKRRVDELPWQLTKAELWPRLNDLLSNLAFFKDSWEINEFDVKEYWARVEGSSTFRIVDAYRSVVESPEQASGPDSIMNLARLLKDTGHLKEALRLWTYLMHYFRDKGEENELATSLGNRAVIYKILGNPEKAMLIHKKEEQISRRRGDMEGLHRSLGNQALILHARGDLDEAIVLHQEEEDICRKSKDKKGLSICLGHQGVILYRKGNLNGAIALFSEQERICRELGDKESLLSILANKALIHKARGELDEAMAQLMEQERISRSLGNKDSLQEVLGNRGVIFYGQGHLDEAIALFKEQEEILRELRNKDSLQRCLDSHIRIYLDRNEIDQALARLNKRVQILRELGYKEELARALATQSTLLAEKNPNKALLLAEEAYQLAFNIEETSLKEQIKSILSVIRSFLTRG
jgi:tetratricopeptide (TPR) repeat protein